MSDTMRFFRAMKRYAANVCLILVSLLLALLVVEGTLRLFDLRLSSYHPIGGFCQYDEILGWRLAPNRTGLFQGTGFSVEVEQSEQGLRDRLYPFDREAGRRRILVLGDSVVWCWGVEMRDCFTERIESRLPLTDVIAAGTPGYGTAQELLLYERELSRFRPDLTLLVFVSNDPADNLSSENRPVFARRDGELVLTNVPVPRRKGAVKEWLMSHSALFRQLNYAAQLLRHRIKMAREGTQLARPGHYAPLAARDRPEARRMTEILLERLRGSVAADGGRLAIVNSGDAEEEVGEWLAAFARPRGIPFLDLSPGLRRGRSEGLPMTLQGDPHYSVEAHAIVAESILAFLHDEDLLNRSTDP